MGNGRLAARSSSQADIRRGSSMSFSPHAEYSLKARRSRWACVEHPQELINERQLEKRGYRPHGKRARIFTTAKTLGGKSAAYSFCMSGPVPRIRAGMLAIERHELQQAGAEKLANGAIVVPVARRARRLRRSLEYQRRLERAALKRAAEITRRRRRRSKPLCTRRKTESRFRKSSTRAELPRAISGTGWRGTRDSLRGRL